VRPDDAAEQRRQLSLFASAAEELEQRIASIHLERPCPECGAEVGERCRRMSRRGGLVKGPPNKHPHRARYQDLIR